MRLYYETDWVEWYVFPVAGPCLGARRRRSTDTALALLLGQIRTAWENPGAVATVLSLDVSGAFDRVLRGRLVHEMRRRGVLRSICGWVDSFMLDRRTTLAFDDQESEAFDLPGGIPQGSPLSPILFLFYNAELLERCERRDLRVSAVGFVDDVNLIAYGDSTEDNCRSLQEVHRECMEWARRYGARFAPEKYELMHFTRRQCFHLEAPIQVEGRVIHPRSAMRVLGVWLDPRLRWKGHLDALAGKLKT